MAKPNPTASKRLLGGAMRRLRKQTTLTGEDVAARLEWSLSKVSNIETGRVMTHPNDVKLLLDLYGVTDADERDTMLALARETKKKGWWQRFGGSALQSWASQYIGLEDAAVAVRHFGIDLLYGPLQTEDYARAVIAAGYPQQPLTDINRSVELRMARRQLLADEDPPALWAVLDEAALRRTVGGTEVMRDQLEHLTHLATLPHVEIQVLPFATGAHSSMGSQFQILSFAEGDDVVYLEDLTSSQYLERATDLTRYNLSFDYLRARALGPEESVAMIAAIARELE